MKEKFIKGSRGAVAIFLVMILVPMMTISCLFVDMSRVKLAKSVVDAAGDLTLNSALTQYDTLLQEYYGLFATSQSIDETLEKMEDYFYKCIRSSGIGENDAQLLSSKLIGSVAGKEESITDILNILVEDDFSVSKTPGGSICNPILLRSQLVNFMKYRAPINTGLSLLTSLKSFKNLSKETELIEKRQEYYEAEEEVNTTCKSAWEYIDKYNSLVCCTDTSYFNTLKQVLATNNGVQNKDNIKKRYENVVGLAYKLLYISNNKNTNANLSFTNPVSNKNVAVKEYLSGQPSGAKFKWYYSGSNCVYSSYSIVGKYSSKTYSVKKKDTTITVNTTQEYDLTAAIETAYKSLCELNRAAADIKINSSSGYEKIRYVYYCVEKNANYTKAAKNFANAMQVLEHRYRWIASSTLADGFENVEGSCTSNGTISFTMDDLNNKYTARAGDKLTKSYSEWYNYLSNAFKNSNGSFMKYYSFAANLASEAKSAQEQYTKTIKSVDDELKAISEQLNGYVSTLEDASKYLTKASDKLATIYAAVSPNGTLSNAKNSWSSSTKELDDSSTIAAQDKAEIANIGKQFKPEDIKALKDRIDTINTNIKSLVNEIKNFKFGSKPICEIISYNGQLRGALHGVATQNADKKVYNPQTGGPDGTPVKFGTGNNTLNHVSALMKLGFKAGNINVDWINQPASNPYLKQNILPFYVYLYKNFNKSGDYNQITNKDNNGIKTENKELNKNAEKAKDAIESDSEAQGAISDTSEETLAGKTSSNDISAQKALPSKSPIESLDGSQTENHAASAEEKSISKTDASGAAKSAKDETTNLFKDLGKWLADASTDLRDNIYLTEYVMDMLSYNTIEYSGNANSKKVSGGGFDLKSLTCKPINADNNFAYKSEVEYVLYGGTNAGNVAAAYASIYGVRLAFNLVYAFTNSELKVTALAIATPISAATLGVVPVPLIQYGLLAACALAESGIDIATLSTGEEVPLYKNEQTWRFSLSGGMSSVLQGTSAGIKKVAEAGINKGVDELSKCLDMTADELSAYSRNNAEALSSNISTAFDTILDEQINVVINELSSSVISAIQQSAGMTGNFDMENTKKLVKQQMKSWGDNDTSTGLVGDIKKAAVNEIISNDVLLEHVITRVNDSLGNVTGKATTIAEGIKADFSDVKNQISLSVRKAVDFSDEIKKAQDSAKEALNSGADSLKESINSTLDKLTGSTGGSGGSTNTGGTSSLFAFSYRDYLRLFLLIKFMSNPDTALLRLADVIQVNMAKVGGDDGYKLKNSSCYLTISATVYIKPLFIAVPLVADTARASMPDGKEQMVFEYSYKKTMGY